MNLRDEVKDELIFSLDIGTRTIIGIVGEYDKNENFEVLAYSIKEHKKRNMYDGQIHDIEGVADIVKDIIVDLEEKTGVTLKTVSIAAAGRALKTHRIKNEHSIDASKEISKVDMETLELEAVQKAQKEINDQELNKKFRYYSIGYTIVEYYLDDNRMDKLVGHRGEKIGVELLATFLPQIVIEGLYSVISRVGLEVGSITLEPIAAINVAIKKELRLLNLALVDIGAGTSDIAITEEGQITSYAMTQTAGDEITERLAQAYLLDFNSSERLKIQLSQKEQHEFVDIVGIKHNLSRDEIVENIIDVVHKIAKEISDKILDFNGKAPDAVFLIGGSSQMPKLKEVIAENLGIPKERVSIRDTSFIENIGGLGEENGPDMITPIGIAIEGALHKYRNFIHLNFNGEEIRIFNTENIKVSDVLIMTGYNPRKLMPKRSEEFVYYVNEEMKILKGKDGSQPLILVDEKQANLKTEVYDKSVIVTIPSRTEAVERPFLYEVISRDYDLDQILINGNRVEKDYLMNEEDRITLTEKTVKYEKEEKKKTDAIIRNIKLTINNEEMEISYTKDKFIFVDIFEHIDFDLTSLQGKLNLKLNGNDVEYMEELKSGDNIKVYWE